MTGKQKLLASVLVPISSQACDCLHVVFAGEVDMIAHESGFEIPSQPTVFKKLM